MPRKTTSKSLSLFRAKPKTSAKLKPAPAVGDLPEWNLEDLYPSMESRAFADDVAKAESECKSFHATYKGKIEALAKKNSGSGLLEAIKRYEALEELLGRIMSYAGLVYSGDTTNPARMKFYGDTQEKITSASSDLLFFELELNRLDDDLAAKLAAGPLKHYRPWLEDIRKGKPYQLDDKLEQLFHEKSITGFGAWNRLFDETIASLRFTVDGEALAIEPVLNLMQDPSEKTREKAAIAFGATLEGRICGPSPSSPTRWPRTRRSPTAGAALGTSRMRGISPTGSSARWSMRWSPPCAAPIRASRTAITGSRPNGSASPR